MFLRFKFERFTAKEYSVSFEFYSWQGGKASALTEKHGKLLDALDGV